MRERNNKMERKMGNWTESYIEKERKERTNKENKNDTIPYDNLKFWVSISTSRCIFPDNQKLKKGNLSLDPDPKRPGVYKVPYPYY